MPVIFFIVKPVKYYAGVEDTARETVAIANKEKFQLRLGLTHLFQSYFKPLLLELYKRHPDAEINISVTDSSHLETMLNEGTIDLAMIQRPYRSEGFDYVSFDPVRLVAVISKQCLPQAPVSPFDYQALAAFPLVLLHRAKDAGTYEMLIDLFRKAGGNPKVIMHITQPRA